MYNYGNRKADTSTRAAGLTTSLVIIGGLGVAVATMKYVAPPEEEKAEVVLIAEEEILDEPPPPPPPVDVELPPPPPMVVVPQFEFDVPPPPAAIQQVAPAVDRPAAAPPAPPAAKPAPPPAVTIRTPPKPGRRFKEPPYPPAALRAKESGETRVSVCVDVDGRMSNAKLVRSSGSTRLDDAAIKAINGNRMEPAIGTDGKPIAMCNPPYEFTYVWNLPER